MWVVEEKIKGKWIVCYSSLGAEGFFPRYAFTFEIKKEALDHKKEIKLSMIAFDDVVPPMRVTRYEKYKN
jgi:hypothetical protein